MKNFSWYRTGGRKMREAIIYVARHIVRPGDNMEQISCFQSVELIASVWRKNPLHVAALMLELRKGEL